MLEFNNFVLFFCYYNFSLLINKFLKYPELCFLFFKIFDIVLSGKCWTFMLIIYLNIPKVLCVCIYGSLFDFWILLKFLAIFWLIFDIIIIFVHWIFVMPWLLFLFKYSLIVFVIIWSNYNFLVYFAKNYK